MVSKLYNAEDKSFGAGQDWGQALFFCPTAQELFDPRGCWNIAVSARKEARWSGGGFWEKGLARGHKQGENEFEIQA